MSEPKSAVPVSGPAIEADVIVVGAGPGGSSAAAHLADAGLDVVLLEKSTFPREKVCGDGLTPRAVKQLIRLGIDISPEDGWMRNRGLRVYGCLLYTSLVRAVESARSDRVAACSGGAAWGVQRIRGGLPDPAGRRQSADRPTGRPDRRCRVCAGRRDLRCV